MNSAYMIAANTDSRSCLSSLVVLPALCPIPRSQGNFTRLCMSMKLYPLPGRLSAAIADCRTFGAVSSDAGAGAAAAATARSKAIVPDRLLALPRDRAPRIRARLVGRAGNLVRLPARRGVSGRKAMMIWRSFDPTMIVRLLRRAGGREGSDETRDWRGQRYGRGEDSSLNPTLRS